MFGSKAKFELLEAKIEIARLKDKLEAKDAEKVRLLEEAQTLRWEVSRAKDQHKETIGQVAELDKKNAVLMERLDLLANHLPGSREPQAFSWPEEAEDAEFRLNHGDIDLQEYEDLLAAAGALNTEVAFDGSDYPRLGKK